MGDWTYVFEGFDAEQERQREALHALANGYMGTRAAQSHARADDTHYPGIYLAGVYNRIASEIEGKPVTLETIPNVPNWLPLTWRADGGEWLDLREVEVDGYRQELDLRRGVLTRTCTIEDASGRRTAMRERRFVHMRHCHLAGLELTLRPENWSGALELSWAIDGRVENTLVESDRQMNGDHLEPVEARALDDERIWLKTRTTQSRVEIDVAARIRVFHDGNLARSAIRATGAADFIGQATTLQVAEGEQVRVEKIAAISTSRDPAIAESGEAAKRAVTNAEGFEALLRSHAETWERLWERCDIAMEDGTSESQRIARVHIFHVLQTASVHTRYIDTGLLARGLTGEAYHGHIFWDEMMVLPYLTFHFPTISAAM